ncbi:S-adenosyl-L-methionine-dependent methyltransferase [Gyrodon lividus]|nr:S-adenosyl-L-methionine-dependent methyltransferase [Gyrodon lividus]
MATFGKTNFNTAVYAVSRPTYPQELYDFIFDFHKRSQDAKFERAIDLGCGTGQATVELTPFKRVTGIDPSENMVQSAREVLEKREIVQRDHVIDFVHCSAENLDFLGDHSIDLVVSAQAGHWFDWSKMWPELARVMRKGASAAFWIYSEFRLPQYPALTPLIVDYDQGTDTNNSVGPYWQKPGRAVLINHLVGIPEGNDIVLGAFEQLDRIYFTGAYYPDLPSPRPIILRKVMSWDDLLGYFRTWSALHTFKEQNPSDAENSDGPLEVRFWNALREGAAKAGGLRDEIEVEWPVAMILARKAI